MTFELVLEEIKNNMARVLDEIGAPDVPYSVEPAKPGFGDATCNAPFLLSRILKKPPREIATQIAYEYRGMEYRLVSGVTAHPSGYVNFDADIGALGEITVKNSTADDYGSVDIGRSSRVIVEHTSVNPNKALHIGHVRNLVIGDTISRILQKANHDVSVLNYVDDSGLQVADIVLGFKRLGFSEEPPENTKFDHYCGDHVYVKTTAEYERRPELEQARRDILMEIEDGSSEIAAFADSVTKRVLSGQLQTCWNLSVTYDCLNYESQIIHSGLWDTIFEKLKALNLIEFDNDGKNAGCWVIRGMQEDEDKVIVRSNGTATYIAKDIPYAAWKLGLVSDPFSYMEYGTQPDGRVLWQTTLEDTGIKKRFNGDRVITVIDSRQSRLQDIVTALMDRFKSSDGAYVHLRYESVTLSSETARALGMKTQTEHTQMSGRSGLYVNADVVYDILVEKSSAEARRRNPGMSDSEISKIAKIVSTGALRYEMIRQDLDKMIRFDLTRSLSLEGDTASYIQYSHARASRILEKAEKEPDLDANYSLLDSKYEKDLIRQIGLFSLAVGDSARNLAPKVMARYCHDLAVAFNSFYEHVKVLDSNDSGLYNARLCLVMSFSMTLDRALLLLGIVAPDRM